MYDTIIVGAGSATGMLLARKGYRGLLLDKAGCAVGTLDFDVGLGNKKALTLNKGVLIGCRFLPG